MIIGIPKEIKIGETRVAITSEGVNKFVQQGHKVLIESGAGEKSGFSDSDYEATGGIIGCNAANYALRVGTKVTIIDKHPGDLSERLNRYVPAHLVELVDRVKSDKSNIRRILPQTDLLINCAVRRPDFKEPHLITRDMLKLMEKGSVLIDATASDHDMVETSKPTSHSEPTFVVDGIIHYCVDNVPAAVPRTSTLALTSKTLPYALEIANKGFWSAVSENEELAKGVMFVKDKIVSKLIADLRGFDYYPLHTVRG